jgi:hypothetical protein
MKLFIRLFVIALLIYTNLLYLPKYAYAWYGAGSTTGWDISTPGIKGSMSIEPKKSPQFYTAGESISTEFLLENTTDTDISSLPLYLHILRITQSPLVQNLGDTQSAKIIELTDNDLRSNTQSGNDRQMPYQTIRLGLLNIPSKSSITVPVLFSISTSGYYQFDLTSYPNSNSWVAGYIYSAGYIRVLSGNSSETNSSTTQSSNQNQSNNSINTSNNNNSISSFVRVESIELSKNNSEASDSQKILAATPYTPFVTFDGLLPLCSKNRLPYIFWIFVVCTISSAIFIKNKFLSILSMILSGLFTFFGLLLTSSGCTYDSNILLVVTSAIIGTNILLIYLKHIVKEHAQLQPIQIFI